jgi:hypothetical protein
LTALKDNLIRAKEELTELSEITGALRMELELQKTFYSEQRKEAIRDRIISLGAGLIGGFFIGVIVD